MFPTETRILIIDNSVSMRQLVKDHLFNMGYRNILVTVDGTAGFAALIEQDRINKPVELVLSDWHMSIMSGLDLLIRVRATTKFRNLPFMLITAEDDRSQVMEAIKHGVSNFLIKPFTQMELQSKLEDVWKKHRGL